MTLEADSIWIVLLPPKTPDVVLMNERQLETDEAIANLIGALAEQYRKQVNDREFPENDVRLEIVRKLILIADSIKGLMKSRQLKMEL